MFKVKLDKQRTNLNTNTVTFAKKYAKSQPRHKIIRQDRKPGEMGPSVGYYEAVDIN